MPAAMAAQQHVRPLDWSVEPLDLVARWPVDRPLVCLISAGESPRARWSIFASPTRAITGIESQPEPLAALSTITDATRSNAVSTDQPAPPFLGGWIGWLSYDLGQVIEPAAQSVDRSPTDRAWPLIELFYCPGAYVHDAESGSWMIVGDGDALPVIGPPRRDSVALDEFVSHTGSREYQESVARAIEYIAAGDIFQANLAHRLSAPFTGSPRAIARRLLAEAGPWYGAYIESPDERAGIRRAVCSASPELFLQYDARTRRVITRPIKGTRATTPTAAFDLAQSPKDAAELTMIVDLMRNDLGRVCDYGSITVDDPRGIESHARSAIQHGVATISGTLRRDAGIVDLIRAAFPPGSITGAPKVRAMQIIDALEPVRRGPYCGCIGYVSDSGDSAWNVAIRTAAISCEPGSNAVAARGTIDYSVGAGIVADSDLELEWQETLHKAGILRRAFPESFGPHHQL